MKGATRPPAAARTPRTELSSRPRAAARPEHGGGASGSSVGQDVEPFLQQDIDGLLRRLDRDVLRRFPALERLLVELIEAQRRSRARVGASHRRTGPAVDATSYHPDARARALIRGKEIVQADLVDAGGAYDAAQTREVLNGISRQALDNRVKHGSVLAVPGPHNRRRYPTFQFGKDGLVPGLREVQRALPTRDPWAVLNFLVNADGRLGGRRPIDVLRGGDVQSVVSAAQSVGMQGG